MLKYLMILLAAVTSFFASAQDLPAFLSKAEVTEAISGKSFVYPRTTDGVKIKLDFKSDGIVYGRGSVGAGDSGTWEAQDNGSVCIKWHKSPNQCNPFFVKEGRLMRANGRTAALVESAVVMSPN